MCGSRIYVDVVLLHVGVVLFIICGHCFDYMREVHAITRINKILFAGGSYDHLNQQDMGGSDRLRRKMRAQGMKVSLLLGERSSIGMEEMIPSSV
jgi:hypothetical protein